MEYHDEYVELISAALDGALSPAEAEKLEEHLAQCPECRALYEDLTAVHTALSDLPPVEVPADLTERIMEAVAAEQVLPFAPAEKKKSSVRWQRWLASAAVLAVVVLGTWSWKPWETATKDVSAAPAAPAAQEAAQDTGSLQAAASALSPVPEAAPEVTLKYTASQDKVALPSIAAAGGDSSAKIGGAVTDGQESMEDAEDAATPRMARMAPEAENGSVEYKADIPVAYSLFPTEAPEGTEEDIQPLMVMANGLPAETTDTVKEKQALTARQALERLLEEYPMPGCETWEYEDMEPGWQSPEWTTLYGERSWLEYFGSENYGDKTYHIFDERVTPFDEGPESIGSSVSYAVLANSGEIFLAGN